MNLGGGNSRADTGPLIFLCAVTLACLAPFLGKAVHMDDPLFIWSARQIQSHPLDFYGFTVHWDYRPELMASITENPPLCSYYLAAVSALFGWSEIALHAGFLLPALALVIGTYFLAGRLCSQPVWAAAMIIAAPGFLLCSTSLMCDTLMVALWTWSVFFWVAGLADKRSGFLAVAAILASAAVLTKYFGLCLVPLLGVYSWLERRRVGAWLAWLAVPVLALAAFHFLSVHLYGESLVLRALLYASHGKVGGSVLSKLLAGLAFSGGCFIPIAVAAPWLWGRRQLLAGAAAAACVGAIAVIMGKVGQTPILSNGHVSWLLVLQIGILCVSGASLIGLAMADGLERISAASALLVLWIAGTFVFTCAINWTVSGRNILPMLPAAAILVARRLESRQAHAGRVLRPVHRLGVLATSLGIAMIATYADFASANAARSAASTLTRELAQRASVVKFEGHWGFQYYMQLAGAIPLNRDKLDLATNEVVVIPFGNSFLFPLPPQEMEPWFVYRTRPTRWITLMNTRSGAGYYSDGWGPLPFVFADVSPDDYFVYRFK